MLDEWVHKRRRWVLILLLGFQLQVATLAFVPIKQFYGSYRPKPGLLRAKKPSKREIDAILERGNLNPVRNNEPKASKPRKPKSKQPPRHNARHEEHSPSIEAQLHYARNGHCCLRGFIDTKQLDKVRSDLLAFSAKRALAAWKQKVEVASSSPELAASCRTGKDCLDELDRLNIVWDALPFLQHFNTWRNVASVKDLCYQLGEAASILLDVPRVRLYQDSLFSKRNKDGPTPWHTDARMAPFDTSHMLTFWIPLQHVPKDGTALSFVSKSHSDFALPFWNEFKPGTEFDRLQKRYKSRQVNYMPLKLGDATVHSGWTLHCADGNMHGDRHAVAITYVDADSEIRESATDFNRKEKGGGGYGDNEDQWSYKDWVMEVKPRRRFKHRLVPIVWPPKAR